MGMDVPMGVVMAMVVAMGTGHGKMLYCNIMGVYQRRPDDENIVIAMTGKQNAKSLEVVPASEPGSTVLHVKWRLRLSRAGLT